MSDQSRPPRRTFNKDEVPRTFMAPAHVEERADGVFEMFREILVETNEVGEDGQFLREKFGKRIGPMMRFSVAVEGESADFTTSRPDGTVLLLHRIWPPELP